MKEKFGWINAEPVEAPVMNNRPVKLMAPLPVATTLAPTCFSVILYACAGWTEKSDAVTALNIKEQRIAASISVFIVISALEPMREITAGPKLATGKAQ